MAIQSDTHQRLAQINRKVLGAFTHVESSGRIRDRYSVINEICRILVDTGLYRLARITMGPDGPALSPLRAGLAAGERTSFRTIPLNVEGRGIGVLWIAPQGRPTFTEEEEEFLSLLAETVARELFTHSGRGPSRQAAA